MTDTPRPLEPWFFDEKPPFPLNEDDQARIDTLNAAGRAIVLRMVEQIALNDGIEWDGITPAFAETAIDRVRDIVHAARDRGPGAIAESDLEELALRYMDAMRLWLRIYAAARNKIN
jgi:hypothetical protein